LFVTIITFFLVLSFLVLIHELGHFTAAKIFKVKVLEFGFGLPPRLFGIKRGETTYSINALPIGGFVRLFGEEENDLKDNRSETKRAFFNKPPLQKLTIILAGVFMNFSLAIIIISFIFTQGVYVQGKKVFVESVVSNSPSKLAGILKSDQVVRIGDRNIESTEDLISAAKAYAGQEVSVSIIRQVDSKEQNFVYKLIPRKNPPKGEGAMGVSVSNLEYKKYSFWQAPYYGTIETMKMTWLTAKGIIDIFGRLIMFREVPKEVAGPVGIAKLVGQAVDYGFMAVLQLMGLLSLNLAVINVFPFPALDGGRLMFVLIEIITRRRLNPKFEAIVNTVGFFILIAVIILITRNDLLRK
jgi:regulator of sigma E protease